MNLNIRNEVGVNTNVDGLTNGCIDGQKTGSIYHAPPPPRTGGVDFLAHRRSSQYLTPIPPATDFSPTTFPPSSLHKTTHLPVELHGGQKFILASLQWKIKDVRMIDSSEFSEFAWGGNQNLYFAYASFGWFVAE